MFVKNLCFMVFIPVPAVLVLFWDYLMFFQDFLLRSFVLASFHEYILLYGLVALICFSFISFPFFGLMADVCIGRHNAILFGIVMCFVSFIIGGVGFAVHFYFHSHQLYYGILCIAVLLGGSGFACFKANIIQYNIDQLVGASADKLNAVIYWHAGTTPTTSTLFYLLRCLFHTSSLYFNIFLIIAPGVAVSLVLVSYSFFKHKLENISLIKNPIKLIVRVLCYARKHKYPENRSALTYWEEETPSRLDLGKEKYGGPFTEEQVEDVKMFFRIIPIFSPVIAYAFSFHRGWQPDSELPVMKCFIANDFWQFVCSVFLLLVYLFIIKVFLSSFIPTMLSRISVGLIFALSSAIFKLIIVKFILDNSITYDNTLIVPQVLEAITFAFVVPASLEFTIAQTPMQMRGVMVGMWTASWGIGYVLSTLIRFQFHCQDQPLCSSYYYYLIESVIIFCTLIVFVILAMRYKYRVRENEVNIVQIVDDHYQRYMEQENDYNHCN